MNKKNFLPNYRFSFLIIYWLSALWAKESVVTLTHFQSMFHFYIPRTVFWCFQGVLKWNTDWKLIKNAWWLTFPFSISFVTNKITQLPSWYTILQKSRTVSGRQPCVAIYSCSLSPFKNKKIFFPWWKSPGRKNDF